MPPRRRPLALCCYTLLALALCGARAGAVADECDQRGMIVSVTLSRRNGATGPERLQGITPYRRAVETILDAVGDRPTRSE